MTRKEWDAVAISRISAAMARGVDSSRAIRWANESTTYDYGRRPEPVSDPLSRPGVIAIATMAWRIRDMKLKFSVATIVATIGTAASAFGAAYTAANLDNAVTTGEWAAIAWAVATAVVATLLHDSTPAV